jgi:hypothetical protein
MWTDFYLKAPSQQAFDTAFIPCLNNLDITIDIVGILWTQGTMDAEGNVLTPPTPLEGYCVNLRMPAGHTLPDELTAFNIPAPNYPRRIFL